MYLPTRRLCISFRWSCCHPGPHVSYSFISCLSSVMHALQDADADISLDRCSHTDVHFQCQPDMHFQTPAHILDVFLGKTLGNVIGHDVCSTAIFASLLGEVSNAALAAASGVVEGIVAVVQNAMRVSSGGLREQTNNSHVVDLARHLLFRVPSAS